MKVCNLITDKIDFLDLNYYDFKTRLNDYNFFVKKNIPLCNLSASEALLLKLLHPSVHQPVTQANLKQMCLLYLQKPIQHCCVYLCSVK